MTIRLLQLVAAGVTPTAARALLPHLNEAFARFEISTPRRMAAFIGQCSHESSGFTRLEENLYYTDAARVAAMFSALREIETAKRYLRNPKALAAVAYANRNGNGAPETGDGWTYRGRGLFPILGRANYSKAEAATGLPCEKRPEIVAEPAAAAITSGWYWHNNDLNAAADAWKLDVITRGINRKAVAGHADRVERCNRALVALTA